MSNATGVFVSIFLVGFAHTSSASARPVVGMYADGAASYQARGSLYAALVNSADMLEDEDVAAMLERLAATPPLDLALSDLGKDNARIGTLRSAASKLRADVLVVLRVKERSPRHHMVSALVVSADGEEVLLNETWTITSRGKKGEERFDYAPVRNALKRVLDEVAAGNEPS